MRFMRLLHSTPRHLIALGMAASIALGGLGAATALAAPSASTCSPHRCEMRDRVW